MKYQIDCLKPRYLIHGFFKDAYGDIVGGTIRLEGMLMDGIDKCIERYLFKHYKNCTHKIVFDIKTKSFIVTINTINGVETWDIDEITICD